MSSIRNRCSPRNGRSSPASRSRSMVLPSEFDPGPGEVAFRLEIPRIELDKIVVEGVDVRATREGAGSLPGVRRRFR